MLNIEWRVLRSVCPLRAADLPEMPLREEILNSCKPFFIISREDAKSRKGMHTLTVAAPMQDLRGDACTQGRASCPPSKNVPTT